MPIKSRPLGLLLMTLALWVSGCATMPQSRSVETVEETGRAIPEPQIATPENEALAVRETLAISPAEVVLQVQELYFSHDDSDTQRDTLGNLHLLVNHDRLGLVLGKGQLQPNARFPCGIWPMSASAIPGAGLLSLATLTPSAANR